MAKARTFWEALLSSSSPNFQIWREALMYSKVRDFTHTYFIKNYPDFLNADNIRDIINIQLNFKLGQIIIKLKVKLPLLATVIKQEQNRFKQQLATYLFEKKIVSLDAEIIILVER